MVNIVPPFLSKVQIAVRVCLANSIVLPWTFLQVNHTSYKYNRYILHTNGFFTINFYAFHVFSKRIIFLVRDFCSNCSHGICGRNQRCTIGAP